MEIKIKKLHEKAVVPKFMTEGAACFDLVATEVEHFYNKATVKLGLAFGIPEGYKLVIVPRSSFTNSGWTLVNSPCQVDPDFIGEVSLRFDAIPIEYADKLINPQFPYKPGDRVAQAYLEKVIPCSFVKVEELQATKRGEGGFGSTGK